MAPVKEPEAVIPTTEVQKTARVKNRFLARTEEKWELNQYWYASSTIAMLTKEIEEHATKVAFLSTPSVWFSLENQEIKNRSFFFDVSNSTTLNLLPSLDLTSLLALETLILGRLSRSVVSLIEP